MNTNKRLVIFLAITFVLTYAIEIFIGGPHTVNGNADMVASTVKSAAMMIPALAVLITRLATKEGFEKGAYAAPNFKGNAKYYLMMWFLIPLLVVIGALFYFAINPDEYSPNMQFLVDTYAKQGVTVESTAIRMTIISQTVTSFLLAPVINIIPCFGEEWGWRGYLQPKLMEKMGPLPAILVTSIIWGLWHAPIIAQGHNYGVVYSSWPFGGIFAMIVFCVVMGTIFGYASYKTGSCLPSVIGHGALNGIASVGVFFTKNGGNPFVGPAATGIIGGLPLVIFAIIVVIILTRKCSADSESHQ